MSHEVYTCPDGQSKVAANGEVLPVGQAQPALADCAAVPAWRAWLRRNWYWLVMPTALALGIYLWKRYGKLFTQKT